MPAPGLIDYVLGHINNPEKDWEEVLERILRRLELPGVVDAVDSVTLQRDSAVALAKIVRRMARLIDSEILARKRRKRHGVPIQW